MAFNYAGYVAPEEFLMCVCQAKIKCPLRIEVLVVSREKNDNIYCGWLRRNGECLFPSDCIGTVEADPRGKLLDMNDTQKECTLLRA